VGWGRRGNAGKSEDSDRGRRRVPLRDAAAPRVDQELPEFAARVDQELPEATYLFVGNEKFAPSRTPAEGQRCVMVFRFV
jgi:hypothetical protein